MILKFLLRNIARRPFLNFINIVGLSLALSCILIIIMFLHNELSFDNFHKNSKRVYRLTTTQSNTFYDKHFARIPNPGFVPGVDIDFTNKGVMRDYPQNSHFHPEFIASPVNKAVLTAGPWPAWHVSSFS